MFETIIHAWHIRKLHKERQRIQTLYEEARNEAKAANKSELELERLFFEERMEVEIADAEIYSLITRRLIQIAERNLIPTPNLNPKGAPGFNPALPGVGICPLRQCLI